MHISQGQQIEIGRRLTGNSPKVDKGDSLRLLFSEVYEYVEKRTGQKSSVLSRSNHMPSLSQVFKHLKGGAMARTALNKVVDS